MLLEAWDEHFGSSIGERVKGVRFSEDAMSVELMDGRTLTVPLAWYPRLLCGSPAQRGNWQTSGAGFGIHWPELDVDLSVEGLLRGAPAPHGSHAKKVG